MLKTIHTLIVLCFCSIVFGQEEGKSLTVAVFDKNLKIRCVGCKVNIEGENEVLITDSTGKCTFRNLTEDTVDVMVHSPDQIMLMTNIPVSERFVIFEMDVVCDYSDSATATCPKCKKSDKTKPISYGTMYYESSKAKRKFLRENYDGGCVMNLCHPTWYCKRDDLKY